MPSRLLFLDLLLIAISSAFMLFYIGSTEKRSRFFDSERTSFFRWGMLVLEFISKLTCSKNLGSGMQFSKSIPAESQVFFTVIIAL